MPKLSIVVIAKNEENRIRECLESAKWADEIVVLDDESTDGTVEIAKEFGASVYYRKMDIEGKHRNYAYSLAKNEWVLSIDCDERITPELKDEIEKLLQAEPELNVYSIPIRAYIGKRWIQYAGYYPARKDRLFRKGKFRYDEEAGIHPRAFYEGKSGALNGDILHYSYENFLDLFKKMNRETYIEAGKWIMDGRKMNFFKMIRKGMSRFLKFYFQKKGYKGGFLGFMFSFLHSLYQLMSYAHYWEMKNKERE